MHFANFFTFWKQAGKLCRSHFSERKRSENGSRWEVRRRRTDKDGRDERGRAIHLSSDCVWVEVRGKLLWVNRWVTVCAPSLRVAEVAVYKKRKKKKKKRCRTTVQNVREPEREMSESISDEWRHIAQKIVTDGEDEKKTQEWVTKRDGFGARSTGPGIQKGHNLRCTPGEDEVPAWGICIMWA